MSAAAPAVACGKKTFAEVFAGAHARAEAALARMEVGAASEVASAPAVYAPQSEGDRAAAPAALLWGSLFAALPRGPRPTLKLACLAQAGKLSLYYTGERLGQDELDMLLALLHLARNQPLGAPVLITGGELLGALGLQDSGGRAHADGGAGARDRLEASLRRLAGALIELRGERGDVLMGHLVASARRGRDGAVWRVTLARELAPAFDAGLAGVDLRVRRALRGKPLAGWLHAWLSSHGGQPKPHRLDTLRSLCGSTSAPKEFRRKLERALAALEPCSGIGCCAIAQEGSLQSFFPKRCKNSVVTEPIRADTIRGMRARIKGYPEISRVCDSRYPVINPRCPESSTRAIRIALPALWRDGAWGPT